VSTCGFGKVDVRLPGKGNSNSHGARPVHLNHHDDLVDSDQEVVNKELSLSGGARGDAVQERRVDLRVGFWGFGLQVDSLM